VNPPEPVLRDFRNIEHRDALIAYEREEFVTDEAGRPVTRWDGVTYKASPVTGEPIPDETAQAVQVRYVNPRKAEWPQADYIVGNPPFIGKLNLRSALGDGYVSALRTAYSEVPDSADFVMHWWHIAAEKVRAGDARRFGFITTNSIKQIFNRRVVQAHLAAKNPLSLTFAIPDHPWVDAADGAAVRIAMTVGTTDEHEGHLLQVRRETPTEQDEVAVQLQESRGHLFADLKIGANVAGSLALKANTGLSSMGYILGGRGFVVEEAEREVLCTTDAGRALVHPLFNGKDITDRPRGLWVIDAFGLSEAELRERAPALWQRLNDRVRPERAVNPDPRVRERWWLFRRSNEQLRNATAGLARCIVTPETAKHRVFTIQSAASRPEHKLVVLAIDDAFCLGIVSSRQHVTWSLAAGSRLGVGNDSVYVKSACFETFPFPDATPVQQSRIRDLAEQIDAHRKRQQAQHPDLTLTGMYNVLEKLRSGEALSAKDKTIHEQGLVSVLREPHDALDTAVFEAYGWSDLAASLVGRPGATTPLPDKPEAQAEAEEELLRRLVELNAQRAAEEARGLVRWLRPDYQNPGAATAPQQVEADLGVSEAAEAAPTAAPAGKLTWPKNMREQVAAVRAALARQSLPPEAIAAQFKRSPKAGVLAVLEALEELGMVRREGEAFRLQG